MRSFRGQFLIRLLCTRPSISSHCWILLLLHLSHLNILLLLHLLRVLLLLHLLLCLHVLHHLWLLILVISLAIMAHRLSLTIVFVVHLWDDSENLLALHLEVSLLCFFDLVIHSIDFKLVCLDL